MPSELEDFVLKSDILVNKDWLLTQLRVNPDKLIILDCRASNEYVESHIRNAVNLSIPSIMLRRLLNGKIDLLSTIKCRDLKQRIASSYKNNIFVLYSDAPIELKNSQHSYTLKVLAKRLIQDGCQIVCLEGGFSTFRARCPEWCESCTEIAVPGADHYTVPLLGLTTLRISPSNSKVVCCCSPTCPDSDGRCDSSLCLDLNDHEFPVEILPHLFLGNAANSEDSDALHRHSIQYILNVTPDLPNVFESRGDIKYMKIPIADHWSQNLASYFPKAIQFIDEARANEKGVLVHCLAGVSRSVTITVAYLMAKLKLNLNDAFNLVRARKSNIAPNFHFMEQLHNLERQLLSGMDPLAITEFSENTEAASGSSAGGRLEGGPGDGSGTSLSQMTSPLALGTSPDSGIEFDRWNVAE